ncbi:hypothetical protein CAPTEDRAFT_197330 [Capitella teleta]|uniref:Uncharacterized protein n=1 Tax=Capitella teleta TaxID=283909 RepID=R7TXF2_CAPTE|nr:hypothetical protein CAPTEDRAFT_197330 [Capitella teleta]|eukprot:ELT95655.1 hypothetical protein CAPTEDRAFT_197330 [Capitella teleta]
MSWVISIMELMKLEIKRRLLAASSTLPIRKILPIFILLLTNALFGIVMFRHYKWDRENVVDIHDADELFMALEDRISAKERQFDWRSVLDDVKMTTSQLDTLDKNVYPTSKFKGMDSESIARLIEDKLTEIMKREEHNMKTLSSTLVAVTKSYTTNPTSAITPNPLHANKARYHRATTDR